MAERKSIKQIKAEGRADRKAIAGAQRKRRSQFVKERDSIHGAAALAQRAVEGTRLTGLKGRYRRQMQKEIAGRSRDLSASLPFMLADAQRAYKADRASLRDEMRSSYASTQDAIREAIAAKLEDQRDSRADQREIRREIKRKVGFASDAANELAEKFRDQLPETNAEWKRFTREVARSEGVGTSPEGIEAARRAVKRLRLRLMLGHHVNPWG